MKQISLTNPFSSRLKTIENKRPDADERRKSTEWRNANHGQRSQHRALRCHSAVTARKGYSTQSTDLWVRWLSATFEISETTCHPGWAEISRVKTTNRWLVSFPHNRPWSTTCKRPWNHSLCNKLQVEVVSWHTTLLLRLQLEARRSQVLQLSSWADARSRDFGCREPLMNKLTCISCLGGSPASVVVCTCADSSTSYFS